MERIRTPVPDYCRAKAKFQTYGSPIHNGLNTTAKRNGAKFGGKNFIRNINKFEDVGV